MLAVTVTIAFTAEAQEVDQRRWSRAYPVSDARLGPTESGEPSVAFNGQMYVVVWERQGEVVGVRIDAQGQRIDRAPLPISDTEYPNRSPEVVWTGQRFLVVWRSHDAAIRGRFLQEGTGLSPAFPIIEGLMNGGVHLASNGSTAFVVGTQSNRGAIVRGDGSVRHVSLPPSSVTSVASNGTDYLLTITVDEGPTLLTRVTDDQAETKAFLSPMWKPQLVSSGSGYLLFSGKQPFTATPVTSEGRVNGEPIVIATEVPSRSEVAAIAESGSLTLLWLATPGADSFGPLMMTRIAGGIASSPVAIGRTGRSPAAAGRLFVWSENDAIRHMHRDRPGLVAVTSIGSSNQVRASSAPTSHGWFTVWNEGRLRDYDRDSTIRATTIGPALGRGDEIVVSGSEEWNGSLAVAASEDVVLVAWRGGEWNAGRLYSRRFTPTGSPLDDAPVVLAAGLYWWNHSVAISWTGRYFLVAFGDARQDTIKSIRMSEDGVVIDSPPRTVATSYEGHYPQDHLAFARGGDLSLLVWQDGHQPIECRLSDCEVLPPARIEGVRFSEDGEPLDPSQRILTPADALAWMPTVAALGDRFLVASRSKTGVSYQIVDRDFTIGPPILIASVSSAPDFASYFEPARLSAAATNREFVIAWDDDFKLMIAFVSPEGDRVSSLRMIAQLARIEYRRPIPHVSARGPDLLVLYSGPRYEDGSGRRAFYRGYNSSFRRRGVKR